MHSGSFLQRNISDSGPHELNPIVVEDLKEMFRILDVDKTGKVNINDLKDVMESIGNQGRNSMVYHLLIFHENQGKNYIDFSDFLQIMAQPLNYANSENDVEKIFSRFDPSLEYIDYDRLRKVAIDLNENLDAYELKEMIKIADPDGDGQVTFDDFYKMMTTPYGKKDREEIRKSLLTNQMMSSGVKKKTLNSFQ